MSVEVVVAPELKNLRAMAAEYLKETGPPHLLLRFPGTLEEYIAQLREGLPYEYVIDQLRKSELIPEPIGAWEYSAEPLLRVLPGIRITNPDSEVHCYGDLFSIQESTRILLEITSVTLTGSVTDQIDTERWRELLTKEQKHGKEAFRRETDSIIIEASKHQNTVCVTNSNTSHVVSELKEEGFEVTLKQIGFLSPPTPLGILRTEIKNQPDISDERIRELVLSHIKYITEYVVLSENPDQAYQKWIQDQTNKKVE